MTTSVPTGASIPDARRPSWRLRAVGVAAALALLAGCAQIKARLPQRASKSPPPTTSQPRPVPRPAPRPPEVAPAPAPAYTVLDPRSVERDRARVLQALAQGDGDAMAASDVGYTLDVLQGRLRQVAGSRATVTRRGQRIAVDLSRAIAFAPAKPQPGPGADAVLGPLGKLLADYGQVLVTVRVDPADAAADSDPRLAQARALALAQAFADAGVAKRRIVVVGTTGARKADGPRIEVQLDPIVRAKAVRPPAR